MLRLAVVTAERYSWIWGSVDTDWIIRLNITNKLHAQKLKSSFHELRKRSRLCPVDTVRIDGRLKFNTRQESYSRGAVEGAR